MHSAGWEATRLEGQMKMGRTKPLIIGCRRTVGNGEERRTFVVKSLGNPEMTAEHLCCEFFGHLTAEALGCNVADSSLVDLSAESVEANIEGFARLGVAPVIGPAFGCGQVAHLSPITGSGDLEREVFDAAAQVYALDLLVQNPDRRVGNPNCAYSSTGRIFVFDFDQAFSFRYPLVGTQPAPWEVSKLDFRRQHIFYSPLQRQPIDWTWVTPALARLTLRETAAWREFVPAAWSDPVDIVLNHLDAISQHGPEFITELERSLQ